MAYTLRLDKKQEKTLDKIKKTLGQKTGNKVFINLLDRFLNEQEVISSLTSKLNNANYQLRELKRHLNDKAYAEKKLTELLNDEVDDEDEW